MVGNGNLQNGFIQSLWLITICQNWSLLHKQHNDHLSRWVLNHTSRYADMPWNVGFAPAIMIIDDCLPTSSGRTTISQRRLQWSVKGMSMWTSTSIGLFRHAADRYISWLMIIILLWGWTNDQWSMRSWTTVIRYYNPAALNLFRVFWNASSQKIWFGHDIVP